ncbi:response regulator [Deferrisoma palaeochoriense]
MTQAGAEALRRLEDLLAGRVRVPADALGRVLPALVQRAGPQGQQVLGLHLVREPDPRRAALLIEALPPTSAEPLIPYLVEGVLKQPALPRGLATVRTLGDLGSPAAHAALAEVEARTSHPALRSAAAARRAEIEARSPARYRWIPLLIQGGEPGPDVLDGLVGAPDPDLEPLLLDVLPALGEAGLSVALRVLGRRGGEAAYGALRAGLDLDRPDLRVLEALAEIAARHPSLAEPDRDRWVGGVLRWAEDPDIGPPLARLACRGVEGVPLEAVRALLASPVEPVRREALELLSRSPLPEAEPLIQEVLSRAGEAEAAACLVALAAIDGGQTLGEWAVSNRPEQRAAAARAAPRAGREDLWADLLSDPDPRVALVAVSQVAEAFPADLEPLERACRESAIPLVVERAASAVGERGDAGSAPELASCLLAEPWRAASAAKALLRLRQRAVVNWDLLGPEAQGRMREAARAAPLEGPLLQVWAGWIEDLPADVLETLQHRLREGLRDRAGRKPSLAEAIYLAVAGRLSALRTAERCAEEAQALMKRLGEGPVRPDLVGALARCWTRPDVEFPPELSQRVEVCLAAVAADTGGHVGARVEAVRALGLRGSAACIPTLVPLCRGSAPALADAARKALGEVSRRHPGAETVSSGTETGGPCVLVVEDETAVRDVYCRYLLEKGFSPLPAADGLQAVSLLERVPVDLVLLDLQLPRLDGFGVLEALARRRRRPPVLVVTAHGDRATVLRVARFGVEAVLVKPVSLEALVERIGRILAR